MKVLMMAMAMVAAAACGSEPATSDDLAVLPDLAVDMALQWEPRPDLALGRVDLERPDLAQPGADLVSVASDLGGDLAPAEDMTPAVDLAQPDMAPMCTPMLSVCSGGGLACCAPGSCRTDFRTGNPVGRCCVDVGATGCKNTTDCCKPSAGIVGCVVDKCELL